MTEKYTGLESLTIANAKEEIRWAKKSIAKMESNRKARAEANSKKAAEDRLAKFKMDEARERFRIGYRKLMMDAKDADKTYSLTVTEVTVLEAGLDTATIMIKVQRLP